MSTKERVVGATKRPDGTWRKPIRIRAGYRAQEEVEAFTSAQVEKKKKDARYVPGIGYLDEKTEVDPAKAKAQALKAKRQRGRQNRKVRSTAADSSNTGGAYNDVIDSVVVEVEEKLQINESADSANQMRNLKKKLRQAEDLQSKVVSGELKDPTPQQQAKIDRIQELRAEIESLE